MVNGGQVCICPDYVFVPDEHVDTFVDTARDTLRGMFPSIVSNGDYCSSVDQANFERVVGLIEDARANGASVEAVAPDGERLPDPATRKIAPTIVRDIDDRMKIADEEIFGPVLVVKGYSRLSDAIEYINRRRRRWWPIGMDPTMPTSAPSSGAPAAVALPATTLRPK